MSVAFRPHGTGAVLLTLLFATSARAEPPPGPSSEAISPAPVEPSPTTEPNLPTTEPSALSPEPSPTTESTPTGESPATETSPTHEVTPTTPVTSATAVPVTPPIEPSPAVQELTVQDRTGDAGRTRERPTEVTLSYSTALALGGTRHFAGDFSFVGFGLDWHRRLAERFSAGLSLGWQVLYDKTRDTTVIDSLTITGVQVRHLNTFPILLSSRFFPGGRSRLVGPYVGLGVGVYPSEWRADIGLFSFSSFSVHFGVAPEIGVQIPTRTLGRLCLGVKYDYAFESAGNPEISYFAFTVGVAR